MGSRYTATSFGTTYLESVVSVVDDLVSNRAIWRKVCCIVLCVLFVLDAWAVITLHVINFTNETTLEVTVSVVVLLAGQYLATGIVDGFIYYRRWKRTSAKVRSKTQEENKEAWVCMRITLTLMGLAPVSRYIESLFVVKRMIQLEKQYMADAVTFAKEVKQPSTLPAGSLISAPAASSIPFGGSHRTTSKPPMDANRVNRLLHTGLGKVQKIRRQFRRTEQDSAYVALASGVAGAGPFLISQGVLCLRRVGLKYDMAMTTLSGIFSCLVIGIVWLCAALTHFYPVSCEQSELDYERGMGQVPVGGLCLLFTAHVIHVTMRSGALIFFTAQFYWIVLGVLAFHMLCVFVMLIVARTCTKADYASPYTIKRASISENLLSDAMFSYVGLFEFVNAQAKFTRTRYMIYYFFYYLENAAMMGAWYVYFTYPEVWYYLPALLVITVAQLLGFILFQLYLYFYSKPRRKTTLCGLCFAHRDLEAEAQFQTSARVPPTESDFNPRAYSSSQTASVFGAPAPSMISSQSGWNRVNASGICDPVFGQQISQLAVHNTRRVHNKGRPHPASIRSKSTTSVNPNNRMATSEMSRDPTERMYRQHQRVTRDPSEPEQSEMRSHSMNLLELSAHEVARPANAERRIPEAPMHSNRRNVTGSGVYRPQRVTDGSQYPSHDRPKSGQQKQTPRETGYVHRNDSNSTRPLVEKGVFKPRSDHQRTRTKWPYVPNPRN